MQEYCIIGNTVIVADDSTNVLLKEGVPSSFLDRILPLLHLEGALIRH